MAVSLNQFLAFCRSNKERPVSTVGDQAEFSVSPVPNGVKILPATGKERSVNEATLKEYLNRFNATGSFLTTDYIDDFRNASYVLGILRAITRQTSPPRQFRSQESHDAERKTRKMLKPFLEARGFADVTDEQREAGSAISQKLKATDATGAQFVMAVKICWRKETRTKAREYSAAQLLARVDKRDWLAPLHAKIDRERRAGVTHLLFVQRAGEEIVHAAAVPLDAVVPIWTHQRDISQRLIDSGQLGRRKKNHAMNGSSPTLWLRDSEAPSVADALWRYSGVEDLARRSQATSATQAAVDDTFDDLPTIDYSTLGSDGAPRVQRVVSGVARSPQVRAEVVKRSGGTCERPGCGARRDYPGFLDVHHILTAEKSDRFWNCVALCPNCHRETHAAPDRQRINDQLLEYASQWKSAAPD